MFPASPLPELVASGKHLRAVGLQFATAEIIIIIVDNPLENVTDADLIPSVTQSLLCKIALNQRIVLPAESNPRYLRLLFLGRFAETNTHGCR